MGGVDMPQRSNGSMKCRRAWVEIDVEALATNVENICQCLTPGTSMMAVVKAHAYGHGAVAVARAALSAGASRLGVATIDEGVELREAGIRAPILVFGVVEPDQARDLSHWRLEPTLCNFDHARSLSKHLERTERRLPVHVKLDTGMSRLGISWEDALEFVDLATRLPNLELASVYSHLATAEDSYSANTGRQKQRFDRAISQLCAAGLEPPMVHLANSAATLSDPALHYDMVRVGLAMYGLYPADHLAEAVPLRPVMQVKARVSQVKSIRAGAGISYGHRFVADTDMRLAVVGIGYADGVPRGLSDKMDVLICGRRARQVGAVTMDQLMIDVTAFPELEVGDVVTLLGKDGPSYIGADEWANTLDTISWEIVCGFKDRLPRLVIGLGDVARSAMPGKRVEGPRPNSLARDHTQSFQDGEHRGWSHRQHLSAVGRDSNRMHS